MQGERINIKNKGSQKIYKIATSKRKGLYICFRLSKMNIIFIMP